MVYDAIVLRSKSRECKNMPSNKYVLITDLDNTLFDWVDLWVNCFSAMLESIVEINGIPKEQLVPEIAAVHQNMDRRNIPF